MGGLFVCTVLCGHRRVSVCLHALRFMSCLCPWDLTCTTDPPVTGERAGVCRSAWTMKKDVVAQWDSLGG